MPPRLIATDLDGTLLRSDDTVSHATRAALRAVVAAGIPVVPVTARPLRWLPRYGWLPEVPYLIFSNGAVVYDRRAGAVTDRRELAPATLAVLRERLRAEVPEAACAVEVDCGRVLLHEPDYPLRSDLAMTDVWPVPPDRLLAQPAVKLLVKAPRVEPDRLVAAGTAAGAGLAGATTSGPLRDLVELATAGVSKDTGLAVVADALGVAPADVVAFGDSHNDLEMLAWAGYAVAVANADPAVRAVADEVTGSNDEDGVATWLTANLVPYHVPYHGPAVPGTGIAPGPDDTGEPGAGAKAGAGADGPRAELR